MLLTESISLLFLVIDSKYRIPFRIKILLDTISFFYLFRLSLIFQTYYFFYNFTLSCKYVCSVLIKHMVYQEEIILLR